MCLNIILFGLYIFGIFSARFTNEDTNYHLEKQHQQKEFINKATQKLKELMLDEDNLKTKNLMEQVYNIIKSSPLESNWESQEYEELILNQLERLKFNSNIDTAKKIQILKIIKKNCERRNSIKANE